ncbi:acyl carrier protein [Streptomyces sp. V4I8]|uniref:acyl carrier protein n=1 Tax=Streptomyces sp. V4I8 TaxID=3156469 RepID=UPI0035117466
MESMYCTLTRILSEKFEVPESSVQPEATLKSLDLDSLAIAEFLAMLQEECGVSIRDGDLPVDATVRQVIAVITSKQSAG